MSKKKNRRKYTELIEQAFSTPTVDREDGVIRGVKILGRISKNNREYSMRALQESAVLCEGVKVYIDHDRTGKERRVGDFFAEIKNVRTKDDGNYGDLYYLKSHPMAESVLERSERFAGSFGLSPHQFGPTRFVNGKQIVESVQRMRSVDVVDTPATTNSLFESEEKTMTIAELVKTLPKHTWGRDHLQQLIEQMDDMGELPVELPAEAEAEDDVSADDQVKSAFRAMVVAAFDDESLDTKATITKIRDILRAQEKLTEKKTEEPAEEEAPAEEEETAESVNSLKQQVALLKAENNCRELLESAGVSSSAVRLKAMIPLNEDERKELIESWGPARGTNGKPAGSPPKYEPAPTTWRDHDEFIATIKR